MNDNQWALVDVETNGQNPHKDSITEIAIVLLDDWQVVDAWQCLVKPERPIPLQIEKITGITNQMLEGAHPFEFYAQEIFQRLSGRIFVAHNARFDYAFIKNAFARIGMQFSEKVLCTVKLSRRFYPQYKRHNLDSLIERFDFSASARHTAMADVQTMHQFLNLCRENFGEQAIHECFKQLTKRSSLPSYLTTSIEKIPDTPGVYLFYGEDGELPLYIGKSVSLKQRVLSHFNADHRNAKELKLSQQVRRIEWVMTAGELGALLLESRLIKEKMPIYNYRLRRNKTVACFQVSLHDGYQRITILRVNEKEAMANEHWFGCFSSKKRAEENLRALVGEFKLCPKLCGLDNSTSCCFHYQLKKCRGACIHQEEYSSYNQRVEIALAQYKRQQWPFEGPIGIKEHCPTQQLTSIHLFDQWRFMGTVNSMADIAKAKHKKNTHSASVDDIKIIRGYFRKLKARDIIQL